MIPEAVKALQSLTCGEGNAHRRVKQSGTRQHNYRGVKGDFRGGLPSAEGVEEGRPRRSLSRLPKGQEETQE